jgi:hypothetical protein
MKGLERGGHLGTALPEVLFARSYHEVSRIIRELKLEASRSH